MDYLYSPFQEVWINDHLVADNSSKEYKTSNKTEEEMKKLTYDENLTDLQKACLILSKGQNFQKYAIYTQIPKILKENDAQEKFLQLLFEDIQTQDEELQKEAAKGLAIALKNKLLDKSNETKLFSLTINILKIWSQPILIAWSEVFHEILNVFPYNIIEKDCLQLITILSDHSQPKSSRYIAAILIGLVSEKIKENFPAILMEKVRALCQDSDIEIRKVMANEVLEKICFSIGHDKIELYVLEKIMELVYDAEINVKCAGIKLAFRVIDAFSLEIQGNRILPLFIEMLTSINEEVLKVISNQIGFIVYKLEPLIKKNPSYISSIVSTFKEYGSNKSDEIRKNFSFNLSAILRCLEQKQFDFLKNTYVNHLINDKNLEIRQTAVSCLHEIIKLAGWEEAHKTFKDLLKALFKEFNLTLLKKCLIHLNEILEAFYHEDIWLNEEYVNNYQDLLGYILNLGNKLHKGNQWRLQKDLLQELCKDLKYWKINDLHEKYLPFIQLLLKNGVHEIRGIACLCLVRFLKVNYYEKKRIEILKYVNEHFFNSKSYFNRMIYLDFVSHSTLYFSKNFLKFNIIPECFKLAHDRVPNIRNKLATLMIKIRKRIDKNDEDNISKFNETVNFLKKDIDLDVSNSVSILLKELTQFNPLNEVFLKEQESFEIERNKEDENLKILELKENEESKKKDSIDLDLLYPLNYSSTLSNKYKGPKNKIPSSAGMGNYRFSSKNMSSAPLVSNSTNTTKLKNKEIASFSPTGKVNTMIHTNGPCFSPQPAHKTSLVLQNSEKNVITSKKIDEKKKEKDLREISSASKTSKTNFEPKMTKFSMLEKEKDKKSPLKKDPSKKI